MTADSEQSRLGWRAVLFERLSLDGDRVEAAADEPTPAKLKRRASKRSSAKKAKKRTAR
jgi:hypothetical protein